jgi:hypothetical protein
MDRYTVIVEIMVYGESPADAVEYVEEAFTSSRILECDGIFGYGIPEDAVDEFEPDMEEL